MLIGLRAIPAILFLCLVMMPFYYICKTHSVPGYLNCAMARRPLALGNFVCRDDHADAGINMYSPWPW